MYDLEVGIWGYSVGSVGFWLEMKVNGCEVGYYCCFEGSGNCFMVMVYCKGGGYVLMIGIKVIGMCNGLLWLLCRETIMCWYWFLIWTIALCVLCTASTHWLALRRLNSNAVNTILWGKLMGCVVLQQWYLQKNKQRLAWAGVALNYCPMIIIWTDNYASFLVVDSTITMRCRR